MKIEFEPRDLPGLVEAVKRMLEHDDEQGPQPPDGEPWQALFPQAQAEWDKLKADYSSLATANHHHVQQLQQTKSELNGLQEEHERIRQLRKDESVKLGVTEHQLQTERDLNAAHGMKREELRAALCLLIDKWVDTWRKTLPSNAKKSLHVCIEGLQKVIDAI